MIAGALLCVPDSAEAVTAASLDCRLPESAVMRESDSGDLFVGVFSKPCSLVPLSLVVPLVLPSVFLSSIHSNNRMSVQMYNSWNLTKTFFQEGAGKQIAQRSQIILSENFPDFYYSLNLALQKKGEWMDLLLKSVERREVTCGLVERTESIVTTVSATKWHLNKIHWFIL